MTNPSVSVVLPTFNRTDVLERTIRAYVRQEKRPAEYEVVVVNDGSTDETEQVLSKLQSELSDTLRVFHQSNTGPGAARNRAIREARGSIVLFAGDDVIPAPTLVSAHLKHHKAHEAGAVAVLGSIAWSDEIPVTPFMRWLEHGGPQFAFSTLRDGQFVPPTMFYTSNLSVPRQFMLVNGMFDEEFTAAGWEDVDLGIRLVDAGLRIIYAQEAAAQHLHETDFRRYAMRIKKIGFFHAKLIDKHSLDEKPRSILGEFSKLIAGTILRKIPLQPMRYLGYRWSLSWIEHRSMQKYWSERQKDA